MLHKIMISVVHNIMQYQVLQYWLSLYSVQLVSSARMGRQTEWCAHVATSLLEKRFTAHHTKP